MAGKTGKSGGARPGAGRPKKDATPRTRGSTWMATRARIFKRDDGQCQCDKCQASGAPLPAEEADHIIPLSQGGEDCDDNLQSLSSACHKAKSAREAAARAAADYVPPAPAATPLEFLMGVMNDMAQDPRLRVRAAITAAQYQHSKVGEGGKKEQKAENAKTAAARFGQAAPPRLAAAGGKKV